MTRLYSAYGLSIESELFCPELPPSTAAPDVSFRLGTVAESLHQPTVRLPTLECEPGRHLLKLEQVAGARFLAQHGSEVIVHPVGESHPETLRLFLLSTCLAAILYQRGVVPLHANTIATKSGAVIIAGDSGVGKSTLSLALMQRGYRILSDDLCAMTPNGEGEPTVQPGIPRLKLWADTLERLVAPAAARSRNGPDGSGLPSEGQRFERLRPELEKYALPLDGAFHEKPLPIRKLYLLRSTFEDRISLRHVTGARKFEALRQHQFCYEYANLFLERALLFDWLRTLAGRFPLAIVTRPSGSFRVAELADLMQEDIER
ncbi:MAG: hypothetical protein ACRED5_02705 [Propylenella sp.]